MQAETIRERAEQIGMLTAENHALEANTVGSGISPEPTTPLRRLVARLWPLGAVLVALVVAGVLLAWP
jgi:hypothetical protein